MIVQLHKILRDLWIYRLRTGLSIFAICVGLVVFGGIATALDLLTDTYEQVFRLSNPAQVMMQISDFELGLLRRVSDVDGLITADARYVISNTRVAISPDEWLSLELHASDDYSTVSLHRIFAEPGLRGYAPEQGTIWLDRSILKRNKLSEGDLITIQTADGALHSLQISGFVNDIIAFPSNLSDQAVAYISYDTLQDMKLALSMRPNQPVYNRLYLRFRYPTRDVISIRSRVTAVEEEVQSYGYQVVSKEFLSDAPPLESQTNALDILLVISAVLAFGVTGVMIANFVSAIVGRQISEIGIMKSLGAVPSQIMTLFFVMMVTLGLIAFVLSIPLTGLMGQAINSFLADMIDIDVENVVVPMNIRVVQFVIALLIPLVAASIPVLQGAMLTVKDTLRSDGTNRSRFIRWLAFVPRLIISSIVFQMAFLNIFMKPGRFVLTTLSLTLPGALFIASFGIEASLRSIDTTFADSLFNYDIELSFEGRYSTKQIEQIAMKQAGVFYVEAWRVGRIHRIYAPLSNNSQLPPADRLPPPQNGSGRPPPPAGARGNRPPPPQNGGAPPPPASGTNGNRPAPPANSNPSQPLEARELERREDSFSGDILLRGVPMTSNIIRFSEKALLSGGWLRDENDLLMTYEAYQAFSLNIDGSSTILVGTLSDAEDEWDVVGVTGQMLTAEGFVDIETFERFIPNTSSSIRLAIISDQKDSASIARIIESLRIAYNREGIDVNASVPIRDLTDRRSERLSIVTQTLVTLSVVIGVVSVVGLISTISINIRERTKSIGILRSLGGDFRHLGVMVFIESLTIVFTGYVMGFLLSYVVGQQMSILLGNQIYSLPATYRLEPFGAVLWFGVTFIVGLIAAFGPALYAVNVTISDTLRYEG